MKKNLMYVASVNLINGLAGIAFIPIAMKSLGAEGYGLYSVFVILASYIYFVEMGVAKYFTRTIAQANSIDEEQQIMQSATGMYIRIALALLIITPILYFVIPKWIFPTNNNLLVSVIVILASLDYMLSIPTTIRMTYNLGTEQFERISKFNLLSGLSKHIFLIGAVIVSSSVIFLVSIVLLRRVVDILYSKKILGQLPKGSWIPKYVKGEFKTIFSQSIMLSIAQLTQVTILSLGTFFVNRNFTMQEVGIYKATFDLATKVWFISNSLGLVIFPRFSSMVKNDREKTLLLNKMPFYFKSSWLTYNVFFLVVFLLYPKMPNFFGITDLNLFFLLLYGACLNAHSNLSYEFLQASARLKEIIITSIITMVVMIGLFYFFLDRYSFHAIGVAWIISQFLSSMCMDFFVLKGIYKSKIAFTLVFNLLIMISVVTLYFSLGV